MPELSAVLSLPYIQPAQAQKHVTHNEALRVLDAITQLTVVSADQTVAPGTVAEGDRYIVGSGATGVWAGQDGAIAIWSDSAWQFFVPAEGWRADVRATGEEWRFDGVAWQNASGPVDFQNLPEVGVNTTADGTNRLAVSSAATLLNNEGAGHQVKVNKAAAADTASLLFQTGFSGRAEMGTAGNDDFSIKVSPDGSTYYTGLKVERATGAVQFPSAQNYFQDVFIMNDSAWSVDIPWANPARIMLWLSVNLQGRFYLVAITGTMTGSANFGEMFANPAGTLEYHTGPLTGTTSTAGNIGLSIDVTGAVPKLWVENRLGSNRLFALATLGK